MLLIVLYLGNRYDLYGFNTWRDITICLFHLIFDLHLWPSAFVKVRYTVGKLTENYEEKIDIESL